jgi:glutamyl-Q tRNA(Asp) synthetase
LALPIVTRFAPSPTGLLHLGHAHSALAGFLAARQAGGRFLLRIEDIDTTRCRPEFERAIYDDLAWLGLRWEEPVRRQSDHFGAYRDALSRLQAMALIYPCFCTRKRIQAEIAASPSAPHGPDGPLYPGTCRNLSMGERARRTSAGDTFALRIDMGRAIDLARRHGSLAWHDLDRGEIAAAPETFGDVVLARKETPTSYHLSVTVDDAIQGVTLVTRGEDLLAATHVHRLLQTLLDLPVPAYRHHRLLTNSAGRRLAKRDRTATLRDLRAKGATPEDVRALAGFPDLAL